MADHGADDPIAGFAAIADEARRRVEECAAKAKARPAYEHEHDAALAKYHLYERHHGRTWSHSPTALVSQIRADLNDASVAEAGAKSAFNRERFIENWRRESERLIARYS